MSECAIIISPFQIEKKTLEENYIMNFLSMIDNLTIKSVKPLNVCVCIYVTKLSNKMFYMQPDGESSDDRHWKETENPRNFITLMKKEELLYTPSQVLIKITVYIVRCVECRVVYNQGGT